MISPYSERVPECYASQNVNSIYKKIVACQVGKSVVVEAAISCILHFILSQTEEGQSW